MIDCTLLDVDDCDEIVSWNINTDVSFLQQWAGKIYTYPLTKEQIIKRIKKESKSDEYIYKIYENNQIIGTIELFNIDYINMKCKIGRFLIKLDYQNKGYGKRILETIISKSYKELGLNTFNLSVFDYNQNAINCYLRYGFIITGKDKRILPNGGNAEVFNMVYQIKEEN